VVDQPRVVSDPAEVTVEWLAQALRSAQVDDDAHLESFESETVGTGQMGRSVRFRLGWRGGGASAPRTIVGKFPSDDPKSRATGVAQGVYRKEVCFYRELKSTVGIRTPRCFFAASDGDGGDFVLLLEDLAPALQGNQLAGCTPDAAELALGELSKLHAPRWNDATLAELDFLSRAGPDAAKLLQVIYVSVWPGFAERYGDRLEPRALALSERLGAGLADWLAGASGPETVVHGDYRLDNMLFGSDAGGYPLAVVDWQTVALGRPLADASYFLGGSLLPDDRRANEHALLRGYWQRLGAAGVSDYSWDECWRDYRRQAFAGIVMSVVASMIVEQTERGDEMFVAMAERHCEHALDLDSEDFLGSPG
jgi:hypothetical protein